MATNAPEISLIRTRLAPPRIGSVPVNRESLLRQLDTRRDRKLSLILGPAGSGKTMLMTQWRQHLLLQGAKVAWFNGGAEDDDIRVVSYLIEGFRQLGLPVGGEGLQLFLRSGGKSWKPLLAALVNDLADHPGSIYLVIDDFHYVSSFQLMHLINQWLALAPPNFHLVLGSRIQPPLDLARLYAEDALTEIRFSDLRFDIEETQRFVSAQGLAHLSTAQVRNLHEVTDGWAAGLQLLCFALRKSRNPELFFERQGALSLSQEEMLDSYLERATLEHLSEEELGFLTRISVCRRFNRELCEVITGDPQAGEHLAKFEAENLFLLPIDTPDAEPWYRFHRLFGSFLNGRLRRLEEAQVKTLHQLASRWFSGQNLHVEAMRHASMAGDTEFQVELLDRAARRMVNSTNFLEFLKWCETLPREQWRKRLNVCFSLAWVQISTWRIRDAEQTLADIARHPAARRPEAAFELQLLFAFRAMRQDDTAAALKLIEPMLQQTPPANPFHSLLLYNLAGLSLVHANQFERAREVARWRHRQDIPDRPDQPLPLIDVVIGMSHVAEGSIREAVQELAPFMDRALAFGPDAAGGLAGYLMEAHYQADEIPQARVFVEKYFELIDAAGFTDGLLSAYRVRARIERLDGQQAAAQKTLKRLEEIGYSQGLDRLIAWSLYEQASMAAQLQPPAARGELLSRLDQLAQRYQGLSDCAWSEIPLAAALAHAEHAFEQLDEAAALRAIDTACAASALNRRKLPLMRLDFMRAILLLRGGQAEAALQLASGTAALARETGAARLLPDLGPRTLPLVEALLEAGSEHREFLCAAQRSISSGAADARTPGRKPGAPAPQIEVLSPRENEVLQLLSKALSVKSMARALELSPGTVKWHLKNVYGKLSAGSREDALAKARTLGILRQ